MDPKYVEKRRHSSGGTGNNLSKSFPVTDDEIDNNNEGMSVVFA